MREGYRLAVLWTPSQIKSKSVHFLAVRNRGGGSVTFCSYMRGEWAVSIILSFIDHVFLFFPHLVRRADIHRKIWDRVC